MPIIDWSSKRIKIDPGADIQEIIEALQKDLDSKVTAAVLNAALAAEKGERVEGDEEVLENSKLVLTEEDPESGTHNGYILTQGNRLVGHIHTPSIIKDAYLEKDGDITYLVLEFSGAVEPVKIDVTDLIDIYKPSKGSMIEITIDANNTISATIIDGSITRAKVAEDIEESLKKADDAAAYTDEQISIEKTARVAADADLQSQVTAEVAARTTGDAGLQAAIEAEAEERANKDSELEGAITSEVERATSKEEEIATNLANEITRATGREDGLQAAIESEQSRAIAKETELEEAIAQEVIDRESGDSEEKEARIAEIARVDAAIAQEKADREAKEAEIEASIEKEANDRSEADSALETAYKAADEQIIADYKEADEAVKAWVDGKGYATVAQLNATEATHQVDVERLEGEIEESKVVITESAGTGDILKTYTFTQGSTELGRINLAKDLVVTGGSIVEIGGEKYLRLTIANQEQPVDIKVADLVDVYTTDGEYITLSEGNEISVSEAVKTNLQKASTALQEEALTPYRTAEDQDAIDESKADKATTLAGYSISDAYTKEEVDVLLEESGKVQDVKVNGESVLEGKDAVITLKTVGGTAITGEGDIAVSAMSVVEVLPETPSETTLYKLTNDMTHQEPKIVIDPTTGEEIEVMVTVVDFAKGLYVWIDGAWKSVLADSTAVNYETLINKPRINGKILTGNKSAADLGLLTEDGLYNYQTKEDDGLETTANTIVGAINELKSTSSTVYKYKGSVETVDDLPTRAAVGDSYYVEVEQSTYAYNGEVFLSIGGTADLSAYQKKTDSALKTTNKSVSGAINEVRTTAQINKGAIEEVQTLIGEVPLETEAQTITEAINEIAQGGGGQDSWYGTCDTAGNTAAKVVACTGFTLQVGCTITVKFNAMNTVDNPTMNVNNTGAKTIRCGNENMKANKCWGDNDVAEFTYDGTYWVMMSLGDPTCLWGSCTEGATTVEKKVTIPGFHLRVGATVFVSFSNPHISSSAATLNVNSTGAKTIRNWGTNVTTNNGTSWAARDFVQFVYDGTYWNMVGYSNIPVGTITMFGGANIPAGWILCNGSNISRTTYNKLYAVIGTTFGTGDGSTTFTLPDFRQRVPEGAGSAGLTNAEYYNLGTKITAGIPDIYSGGFGPWQQNDTVVNVSGAVQKYTKAISGTWHIGYSNDNRTGALNTFRASSGEVPNTSSTAISNLVYGKNKGVQMNATAVHFIIRYA